MTSDWLSGNSELQLREQDEAGASSLPEHQRNAQFHHSQVRSNLILSTYFFRRLDLQSNLFIKQTIPASHEIRTSYIKTPTQAQPSQSASRRHPIWIERRHDNCRQVTSKDKHRPYNPLPCDGSTAIFRRYPEMDVFVKDKRRRCHQVDKRPDNRINLIHQKVRATKRYQFEGTVNK